MTQQDNRVRVLPYAKYRRFTAAAYQSVRHKQVIHGLLDVDVTRPCTLLSAHKATTGESLSFTISVDHDIVDGAPAARFAKRLKELIESSYGLDDLTVKPETTPSSEEVMNYVYNS